MRNLFLHIGHPKTGSSALQVTFARNMDALRQHGIVYPEHKSTITAVAGNFAAGNLSRHRLIEEFEDAKQAIGTDEALFYSCEGLFDDLSEPSSQVLGLVAQGVPISVLLFIRNPVEFAVSLYQQRVQGAGYHGTISDFMDAFDGLANLKLVLERLGSTKVPFAVHNFDRNRDALVPIAETWLGLPIDTFAQSPDKAVNRSITRAEQALLQGLSGHLGPSGSDYLGHALVNQIPEIAKELPFVDRETYDRLVQRITPDLHAINALVPSDAALTITPYNDLFDEPVDEDRFTYSRRQIDVITTSLATRAPSEAFAREFCRWVKSLQDGDALSAEDIYRLNEMGRVFRPGNFPPARMKRLANRMRSGDES